MNNWQYYSLGELTENFDTKRIPVKETDRKTGPYPYYGASGIIDSINNYIFDGQYLLIAEDGENLRTKKTPVAFIASGRFWVNNHAHIVRGNAKADTRFLLYALGQADISGYLTGSTIPKLTQSSLNQIRLYTPPLSEQRAIARVLGALDDKIELNRRMNQTLEALARALFQSWFVDFDPVRAKAEGRTPEGMDAATAALFPAAFEDTAAGRIPAGWGIQTIFDVAEINTWTLSVRDELDRIEYVEISEVQRGEIGDIPVYERGQEPGRARRRLRHGDTVLSTVRPDRGAYFLALNPSPYLIASTGFAVVTPTKVPWSFVHAALTRQEVSDHLGHIADGGAYPAVAPEIIGKIEVAAPPSPILNCFGDLAAPMYERMATNRDENRTLAALRDALLPKLLSGAVRVDVRDEEREVAV